MMQQFIKNVLVLVLLCVVGCKPDSPYTTIDIASDFQLKVAESVYDHDLAILNASYRIPYDCPLVLKESSIKSGMKFASYFNLDVQKMIPTIGDLKPKYILLKKKSENIVYGIKAGDTLAFRLIDFPKQ